MMITSKERAYLRSLANDIQPIIHLGKEGISGNLIKQVDDALEARELVKATVQQNSEYDARTACEELAKATNAEPVQCIGRKFVLYRASKNNPRIGF
jgi:RNA-binding protein